MAFNNAFYTEGASGLIDAIWLWYNRISVVLCLILIILAIVAGLAGGGNVKKSSESFVRGTNFRNLNRSRQQVQRYI